METRLRRYPAREMEVDDVARQASLVGSVLAVGAALAAGRARTGGGGVAEADVRRAGIAAPATPAEGEAGSSSG